MANFHFENYLKLRKDLGKTSHELESVLGQPQKQTNNEGDLYFWYESVAPSKANLYRFQQGKVVWISRNVREENILFEEFIANYGQPVLSVKKIDGENDSLNSHVAVWPEKGVVATMNGDNLFAMVSRVELFQPESMD